MEFPMGLPMVSPTAHECYMYSTLRRLGHETHGVGYGADNILLIFVVCNGKRGP